MTAPIGLTALFLLSASSLAAQTVDLRLRDSTAGTPIGGAIVRLVGGNCSVAQGLTDEAGRLVLRTAVPGAYRLRIDRIGWMGLTTAPFALDSGLIIRMTVHMPPQRNRLPTLEVTGKSRCDARQPRGELAAMLWDEVQKALTANTITVAQRLVPLHLREFIREVDLSGHSLRQWVVISRIVRGPPFASLAPSALSTTGFVYQAGDTAVFAGPDAALMLSEQFVATHCFYALQGAGPLAGLAFQPIKGRRVPDVSGTLWVDRETSELRNLEFSYTGLPGALNRKELGGRVEFTQLPGGRWIISYWHIRMPRI
jgi:hypothetical protein